MIISASSVQMGIAAVSFDVNSQAARLVRAGRGRRLELQAKASDEPLYRTFRCKFKYSDGKTKGAAVSSPGEFVVTAERFVMLITRFTDKRGVDNCWVASVRRSALPCLEVTKNKRDEIASIELLSADRLASIQIRSAIGGLSELLKWLAPESTAWLGKDAAEQRRERKRVEVERQAEAAQAAAKAAAVAQHQKTAKLRAQFDDAPAAPKSRSSISLSPASIFDHRKTFQYAVTAPAGQCIDAFARSFETGGGIILRAKWKVVRGASGAVASYGGRSGLAALTTSLSTAASGEQEGAIGSEIKFEIEGQDEGTCYCTMWLAEHSNRIGFVNDGRFFRPYMREVEIQLARLDPSLRIIKS